jgi:hypothetical protein
MNIKTDWEYIYETKAPTQQGWYQEHARFSLHSARGGLGPRRDLGTVGL